MTVDHRFSASISKSSRNVEISTIRTHSIRYAVVLALERLKSSPPQSLHQEFQWSHWFILTWLRREANSVVIVLTDSLPNLIG